ncbi:tetratricopeptide repeat protein [Fuchsiella alkaliacetigena]|uniref:tetratricopeptide repeat protein n=1 Tax=Fuchsiella alkaliacetigena TaxID=957042 RepID=UPI00200AEEC8|nr:tetratricopeptide repeat protein [Fuchsiella alkaliacetigena]MCK8825310.1 tetratricopeptide repeat protein [Fuchsiella alkaliacetigena]
MISKRLIAIALLFSLCLLFLTSKASYSAGTSAFVAEWESEVKKNQDLLKEATDNLKLKFYLGVAYGNLGDIKAGQEKFDSFKNITLDEWSSLTLTAYNNLNGGEFEQLKNLNHLAFLYYLDERYSRSAEYFKRAIELDADNANLYNYKALAYGEMGEYEQAREILSKVENRNDYTTLLLAISYYKTGSRFRAVYYYSRVGDEAKAVLD